MNLRTLFFSLCLKVIWGGLLELSEFLSQHSKDIVSKLMLFGYHSLYTIAY